MREKKGRGVTGICDTPFTASAEPRPGPPQQSLISGKKFWKKRFEPKHAFLETVMEVGVVRAYFFMSVLPAQRSTLC